MLNLLRIILTLVLVALPFGLSVPAAQAAEVHSLDVLGATNTYAYGLNDKGQVVGAYEDGGGVPGFLLHQGLYQPPGRPGSCLHLRSGHQQCRAGGRFLLRQRRLRPWLFLNRERLCRHGRPGRGPYLVLGPQQPGADGGLFYGQ